MPSAFHQGQPSAWYLGRQLPGCSGRDDAILRTNDDGRRYGDVAEAKLQGWKLRDQNALLGHE